MLKILYLDHAPILGGAEKALLHLVRMLDRQRYRPAVITTPTSVLLPLLAAASIPALTMPFERINVRHPALLLRLLRSTKALVRIVRREQPDLLHSYTVRAHIVSALAARLTGVPLVWTMHDRTLPLPLFRLFARVPGRIIFVSQFLSSYYASTGSSPLQRALIPNGMSPAIPVDRAAARRKLGLDPDAVIIVNVGRLIEGKGQQVLLEAAARIAVHRPNAIFLLVGGPNEGDQASARYAQLLREMAGSPALSGKAIITGQQPDVSAYYDAADLCIYTAVAPEGLPLVLLEAMAHGKPVVASNLGPTPELVKEGVNGRLVPPGDAGRLADTIMDLLDDAAVMDKLGAAGRQTIVEGYDPEAVLLQTQQVYEEVLAKRYVRA